ncbi:LysR family transcriptional regulator [Adhaeribacter swui]|uniref:LysR family transcriptional regulator n=1 Tax=Adhaeribacter swui TaxID=2086471 RepID=A0A7G7GAM4_9BACT|nr:winged helix-turn-helix domain-containing protein [Adhaeribacter swui]QNF34208.1 LysR family transcriptional regulator [Adhaeribacter swui]
MKDLFAPHFTFRVSGRLWVESDQDRFLGPGRIELLEKIQEFGSISKAAAAMGMSYKKAWDLVASMNQQARNPLVVAQTGGTKGGGAHVTKAGEQAISSYKLLQARFQAFLENENKAL